HYGIFSGRRWREVVYPQVRDFILQFNEAPAAARRAAPARKKVAAARKGAARARATAPVRARRK
ncbi:MAG TPA: polyhydroxyalkanoate depolymerase, partial [Ramlibacter sp.]|nr:polyhydroxyalkanoate depolymerase [Ramlibacter sp.]